MAVYEKRGDIYCTNPKVRPIIKAIQCSPEIYISKKYEYIAKQHSGVWTIQQRLADGHPWRLYAFCSKDGNDIVCSVIPRDRKGESNGKQA